MTLITAKTITHQLIGSTTLPNNDNTKLPLQPPQSLPPQYRGNAGAVDCVLCQLVVSVVGSVVDRAALLANCYAHLAPMVGALL
jgi:hypothetical protein